MRFRVCAQSHILRGWLREGLCDGRMEDKGRCVQDVDGGKRPLGRPRHVWQDNVMTVLAEMGWRGRASQRP